jgi:hypothetical protein
MMKRDIRRKIDDAAKMRDRLGDLAILIGNQTE